MAIKIYKKSATIIVEDTVALTKQAINSNAFDWGVDSGNYKVRDSIQNQSYDLGAYTNVQDESGTPFASASLLEDFLNGCASGSLSGNPDNEDSSLSDTYNMSNSNAEDDFTNVYDLASGDTELIIPVFGKSSARIEILWGTFNYDSSPYGTALDAADGTISMYESIDGENSQINPASTTITMTGGSGSGGFETNEIKSNYIHIPITVNSVTAGTVRVLVNLK